MMAQVTLKIQSSLDLRQWGASGVVVVVVMCTLWLSMVPLLGGFRATQRGTEITEPFLSKYLS